MRIDKLKRDNQYIKDEPMEQLRDFAQAWSDRAGGQNLRSYIAILDEHIHNNYVQLPMDSEGVIWTGKEARMICRFEDKPEDQQPTDENPAICDGLLYDGVSWKLFQLSLDGEKFSTYMPSDCRHVHKFDETEALKILSKQLEQAADDEAKEQIIKEFTAKYTVVPF